MQQKAKSLFKSFYIRVLVLFITFTSLFLLVNYYISYTKFKQSSIIQKEKHVSKVKETLRWEVQHFIELIKYTKKNMEDYKRFKLKEKITDISVFSNNLYKKYKDTKTDDEIKEIIIETLRSLRSGKNGYYFLLNTKGTLVLYPEKPYLEGFDASDIINSHASQEIINLATKRKEGFIEHLWSKSDTKGNENKKISYIKLFEPFDWVIGTGIYKEDLEKNIQEEVLNNIEQMKFDSTNNNYIFIGTWKGKSLTYPAKGKNMYNVKDKNGKFIVQELIKKAQNGGGFVNYVMPSLEDERHSQKISYTQAIKEWQWYVGAGLYIDDINEEILKLEKKMYDELINMFIITFIISLVILLVFSFLNKRLNNKIKKDFSLFIDFFNNLVHNNAKIDIKKLHFEEFLDMAKHANQMLKEKKELKDYLEQYKKIVSSSQDFLALLDDNYVFKAANETYAKYFKKDIKDIVNHSTEELFGKELFDKIIKDLEDRAFSGESYEIEHWLDFPVGRRYVQTHYNPIIKDGSKKAKVIAIASRDITDKKIAEEKLKQWATVFQSTSEAVMICDLNSIIVNVNPAFELITGYTKDESIGEKPHFINYDISALDGYDNIFNIIKEKGSWSGEVRNKHKNGYIYPSYLTGNSVFDDNGNTVNYIATFSDITKLKESEKRLEFLAHHDILTKLPNRVLLKDRVTHAMQMANRENNMVAICFIDLDNFKKINDSYGHAYGDDVLVQVTKRIKKSLRNIDTLSRVGGDEFILLVEGLKNTNEVINIINKLKNTLEAPFISNNKKFFLTASIGISMYPEDSLDSDELIKNADIAMYEAKDAGKNTFKFYTKEMSISRHKMVDIENSLKDAIKNKEFVLYYQPQVDLETKKTIGLEALIRWNHPQKGILSPLEFIKLAEDTKMIIPIGEFVIQQACEDIQRLKNADIFDGKISINVSGIQIEHSDLLSYLNGIINETRVDPKKIELEITESIIMHNPGRWIEFLNAIRQTGVKIAIDDFGTGYSSLNYLRKLPIDKLKIDMSFVRDVPNDEDACAVVNSIIDLANNMKMKTLAEGIETVEQEKYLAQNYSDEGQGYLYSKPMSYENLLKWFKEKKSQ